MHIVCVPVYVCVCVCVWICLCREKQNQRKVLTQWHAPCQSLYRTYTQAHLCNSSCSSSQLVHVASIFCQAIKNSSFVDVCRCMFCLLWYACMQTFSMHFLYLHVCCMMPPKCCIYKTTVIKNICMYNIYLVYITHMHIQTHTHTHTHTPPCRTMYWSCGPCLISWCPDFSAVSASLVSATVAPSCLAGMWSPLQGTKKQVWKPPCHTATLHDKTWHWLSNNHLWDDCLNYCSWLASGLFALVHMLVEWWSNPLRQPLRE